MAEPIVSDQPIVTGTPSKRPLHVGFLKNNLRDYGMLISLVVISSEMPELLGICDRIYVMNDGAFVGEFAASDASQEKIMRAIMKSWDK